MVSRVVEQGQDGDQQVGERGPEPGDDAPPQRQRQHRVRRVHHEEDVPHEPLLGQKVQTGDYETWNCSFDRFIPRRSDIIIQSVLKILLILGGRTFFQQGSCRRARLDGLTYFEEFFYKKARYCMFNKNN